MPLPLLPKTFVFTFLASSSSVNLHKLNLWECKLFVAIHKAGLFHLNAENANRINNSPKMECVSVYLYVVVVVIIE